MKASQSSEHSKLAEDMLRGIAPGLGPILSVPSTFHISHVSFHLSDCMWTYIAFFADADVRCMQ